MDQYRNVYIVDEDYAARIRISERLISSDFEVRPLDEHDFVDLAPSLPPGCAVIEIFPQSVPNFKPLEIAVSRPHALPSVAMCEDCTIPIAVTALKLGAIDVYEKRRPVAGLISIVEKVVSGIPAELEKDAAKALAVERILTLTPRQFQILKLTSEGRLSKTVAYELNISPRTVEMHRESIMKRLNCKHMWEAVLMLQSVVGEEKIAERCDADIWNSLIYLRPGNS